MKTRFITMRIISKSFEIILFLLFVLVPCSVFADDFEDEFIDAQFYEQANETNNKSNEDFWGLTPYPVLDNQDLTSEPTQEEDPSGSFGEDPEQLRNSNIPQDPEPEETTSPDPEPEESKNQSPGTTRGSSENDEASVEPLDYSEDFDVIINLLQNIQLTMMIVCGIIIGFFFITRLLP